MKKLVVVAVLAVGAGVAYYYSRPADAESAANPAAAGAGGTPGAAGAGGRAGGRGSGRPSLTVDTAPASRHEVIEYITVVGNLIGQATVDVVPRVAGRIESLPVKLGDHVTKGQLIAKIEDRELQQQVKQVEQNVLV